MAKFKAFKKRGLFFWQWRKRRKLLQKLREAHANTVFKSPSSKVIIRGNAEDINKIQEYFKERSNATKED